MTNAQIVGLGVRLFSIWLALYVVSILPSMWSFVGRDLKSSSGAAIVVLLVIAMAVVALLLWMFPLTVARKLIPRSALDQPTPLPIEQVQSVGFSLLGLWCLSGAIPSLFWWGVTLYHSTRPEPRLALEPANYAALAQTIAELLIGVWLLFGARGLLGILRWARSAGTAASSDPDRRGG